MFGDTSTGESLCFWMSCLAWYKDLHVPLAIEHIAYVLFLPPYQSCTRMYIFLFGVHKKKKTTLLLFLLKMFSAMLSKRIWQEQSVLCIRINSPMTCFFFDSTKRQ